MTEETKQLPPQYDDFSTDEMIANQVMDVLLKYNDVSWDSVFGICADICSAIRLAKKNIKTGDGMGDYGDYEVSVIDLTSRWHKINSQRRMGGDLGASLLDRFGIDVPAGEDPIAESEIDASGLERAEKMALSFVDELSDLGHLDRKYAIELISSIYSAALINSLSTQLSSKDLRGVLDSLSDHDRRCVEGDFGKGIVERYGYESTPAGLATRKNSTVKLEEAANE